MLGKGECYSNTNYTSNGNNNNTSRTISTGAVNAKAMQLCAAVISSGAARQRKAKVEEAAHGHVFLLAAFHIAAVAPTSRSEASPAARAAVLIHTLPNSCAGSHMEQATQGFIYRESD